MSLGPDIAAILPEMRADAESLMLFRADVHEQGRRVSDPVTGESTYVPGPQVLSAIRCGIASVGIGDSQVVSGGQDITLRTYMVKVPVATTGIRVGMVITITAATPPADADLVGRVFQVLNMGDGNVTFATQRRIVCHDILG